MDHTTHYRIPRDTNAWADPKRLAGFSEARGCYPSKVWGKVMDDCECCDPAHEQPEKIHERCEVTEFDFGPRWTFVLYDHKRADGMASMATLDVYHEGKEMTSFTFDKAVLAPRGWLGAVCQAENKMLQVMGAPVDARLLPTDPEKAQTAAFKCKLDEKEAA